MTRLSFSQAWTFLNVGIALWILLSLTDAEAAVLKPSISVTGSVVTLGDLFDDAGAASNIVIATAPRPGTPTAISVSRISQVARRNGIAWRNTQSLTRVVVSRTGVRLPIELTRTELADAITQEAPTIAAKGIIEVVITSSTNGLMVTDDEIPSLSVEQIRFDMRSGHFQAIVRVPADESTGTLHRLSGRAFPVLDIPVLMRRMSPGDKISESDINWLRVPATRVSQNIIDDPRELIGFTPRRGLRPGELIRANDVEPPRLVEKGAIVSISYAFANMSLSARGRALEDGALGKTIKVLNQRSHRTIQVVVTGINEARVGAADPVQLSAIN